MIKISLYLCKRKRTQRIHSSIITQALDFAVADHVALLQANSIALLHDVNRPSDDDL
jgi:hypothetical protein